MLRLLDQMLSATTCMFSNGTIQETNVTAEVSSPLLKSSDVDMNCDEVQETNTKSNLGSHYLNQPVRCLSLCGHLQ